MRSLCRKLTSRPLLSLQAYALVLSALTLFARPSIFSRWTSALKFHLTLILLVGWAVYAKRDIYPLLTFTESTQDRLTPFMWAKLAVRPRSVGPFTPQAHSN